ncbi:MAG TPA: M13 family metallopeptidase N-terminal domain-containing protein, partial [Candidatus Acidoferrum sp.]|nr:M13 family metallopeptidase N-terminal domain-containing protein [Candidatus Acidoferrum sp.]
MRAFHLVLVFLVLVTVATFSQSAPSSKPGSGFSIDNIDKTVDPCVDFYQYACGNWIKNSEIPADRASWQSFSELNESNLNVEKQVLEKAASGGPGRNALDQKIGDLYGSCMDEKAVDTKGLSPLKPELDRIAAAKDKSGLIDEIAHIHLVGPNPLFNFYSNSDLHNADQVIAYIDQGGLSLPDRDYYVKDDPDKVEMRKHLTEYVTSVFTLAGQSAQRAATSADTVLMVETLLAANSMDRTKRRDPK